MKKTLTILLTLISLTAAAQIGYVDVPGIVGQLPAVHAAQGKLDTLNAKLQSRLNTKIKEYEAKAKAYESLSLEIEKKDALTELETLKTSIEKFQKDANVELSNTRIDLLTPVYDRVQKAIDKVAVDQKLSFVLKAENLVYADTTKNITKLVLKELDIK